MKGYMDAWHSIAWHSIALVLDGAWSDTWISNGIHLVF